MPPIDHYENPPPMRVMFGQTLLRCALGLILVTHGAQNLMQLAALRDALAQSLRIAPADAITLAYALVAIHFAAGAGLILGRFTRTSAFVLVSVTASTLALEVGRTARVPSQAELEHALLVVGAGVLFMLIGGGWVSLDRALFERRRRKAIERDAIWSQPPYVSAEPDAF